MKTCTLCMLEKPLSAFEPQRRQCMACRALTKRPYRAAYYAKHSEIAKKDAKRWREENLAVAQARRKAEYEKNAEAAKIANAEYRKKHPEKVNAWSRKHVLAKQKRTPPWLSEDDFWLMEQAYEIAALRTKMFGFQWDVDHKIPLQGKLVSGLHVPHNLQVVPAKLNRSKSNKFVVT